MKAEKILLVHDDENIARYIRQKLTAEWDCPVAVELSADAGLETFKEGSFQVVIIKFGMTGLDAVSFIKSLKKVDPDISIIVFMDHPDPRVSKELSILGVYEFVSSPVNIERLHFIIQKGLELHSLMLANRRLMQGLQEQNSSLQKQNIVLAKRIEDSTKNLTRLYEDLRNTYMRTIKALAHAIDARDHYTHSHSENVARYAVGIAEALGLSIKEVDLIRDACELHDLGKIGIEDKILSKPSSLTPEEWIDIKKHPLTGAQILEPLTFLNGVTDLVKQHHERYDGKGYPQGLKGEQIQLGARIIHLADAYDSMVSPRAYRKVPLTKEEALTELKVNSGTQFDPKLVEVFLKIVDKL